MAINRPVLRYYGGKFRLAPWIIEHFPEHRIYCEPYGGGGSVLLRKPRSYGEVYNDLDKSVVNVFRVLRDQPGQLEDLLRKTPFAREEFELSYRRGRTSLERARRTIVLSFMGFGSDSTTRGGRTGFRNNSNRSGTTPAQDWASYPENISRFRERLEGVVIENRDAIVVMKSQDTFETLFYVDPPYVRSTRTSGNKAGYRFEMTDRQHQSLLAFLTGVKGMVVLSGYPSPIYLQLEENGWIKIDSETLVFGNRPRTECLWMNPRAVRAMPQPTLFQEAAQ
jgi:DNA adenine methylase